MKISTKGRYALRLMADIAQQRPGEPVSLRDAARRQGLSDKYLEQIVTPLARAGLVRSVRGAGGGYLLTRKPEEYTVGDILRPLEGDLAPVECATDGAWCARSGDCLTVGLWQEIHRAVSAVVDGKCVDTTMGLGPLAGFPMGTRSGDVDATILEYLMGRYGYDIKEMLNILNKKSGVLGISGVSSDFRDLDDAAAKGNERAQLALDKFAYEVRKFIGAYASAMGGVDAIVFTAGVGENSTDMRKHICQGLEYMGVKMDAEKNKVRGKEADVSTPDSKVKIFIIPTNEELMIAMDTAALCK